VDFFGLKYKKIMNIFKYFNSRARLIICNSIVITIQCVACVISWKT